MTAVDVTLPRVGGPAVEPVAGAGSPHGILRAFRRDRTAMVGLGIVAAITLAAILAPALAPSDPNAVDVARKLEPPSREFLMGTDHLGRDVFSRLLYGARLSIGSTLVAAALITVLGLVIGLATGYFGGLVDTLGSRLIEIMLAFPTFLLALAVVGVLGIGLGNIMLAIVIAWWASYARIVRSAVLSEKSKQYIEASRAMGATTLRTLARHVAPNVVGPVLVLSTLDLGSVLLGISGFSFLGLGVSPPTAEWGAMLSDGRPYLGTGPHTMFFPGLAIFLMVLGFNLVGDGLRDAIDPKTRERATATGPRGLGLRRRPAAGPELDRLPVPPPRLPSPPPP